MFAGVRQQRDKLLSELKSIVSVREVDGLDILRIEKLIAEVQDQP